jgi:hypothetical protein
VGGYLIFEIPGFGGKKKFRESPRELEDLKNWNSEYLQENWNCNFPVLQENWNCNFPVLQEELEHWNFLKRDLDPQSDSRFQFFSKAEQL